MKKKSTKSKNKFLPKVISSLMLGASLMGVAVPFNTISASATSAPIPVVQIDADSYNFAVTPDGTLASAPTGLSGIKSVSFDPWGGVFYVMKDGSVKVIGGMNGSGQLGLGYKGGNPVRTPTTIPNLTNVKKVEAYTQTSFALLNDGTVDAWGETFTASPTPIKGLTNVKDIEVGVGFMVALLNDGTVKTLGWNCYNGQLGNNRFIDFSGTAVPGLSNVKQIAVGGYHTLALLNDGTVKAWGENNSYQLGNGNNQDAHTPITIPGLTNVKEIGAGNGNSEALLNDGTVETWGDNSYRQSGDLNASSYPTPHIVKNLPNIEKLVVGRNSTYAIEKDGTIILWGQGMYWNQYLLPTIDTAIKFDFDSQSSDSALTTVTTAVNTLTSMVSNLTTQTAIDSALQQYNSDKKQVDALPDSADKTTLENQLASDLNLINTAQATLDMNSAQTMANALSTANPLTQQAVTSAQTALTKATTEVSALASSTAKTNLQAEGQAVQETINEAQATLDINSAKTLADGLSGNLSQDAISTAQSALDKANSEVSALVDGTVKANLQAEAPAIQETINVAQATLDVQNAEVSINQNDVTTAQTAIDKLSDGDVKTALETRLTTVQDVVNATNSTIDTEASLATLNTTLATEDLTLNGQPQQDALVSQLQSNVDSLKQQSTETSTMMSNIPSTSVPTLTARIADLNNRVTVVNGYTNSIQQIVTKLKSNPNKGNGTLKDTTIKVELHSTTDLVAQFSDVLNSQLGTTSGLKFIAIDNSQGTVDANGVYTASKNGVAEVTAYNEKGIVDIIVKVSNGNK